MNCQGLNSQYPGPNPGTGATFNEYQEGDYKMGIEAFEVTMRAERQSPSRSIRRTLETFPNLRFIREDQLGAVYEYTDGTCLFEVLFRGNDREAEFDLCVRFALANPDEVEDRFLEFIRWAKSRWSPRLWQMASATKAKANFTPEELNIFELSAPQEIAALRVRWQRAFGSKRGAVRVEDVYRWATE